ncbi:MAG TPA: AMP-binding protein [Bryobacteraceae bacterium]|nr:AMP-binding protein [Bryobacteraceae bacterium]
MKRDTLLDFFADFADLPDLFLVYDDGFRVEQRSYRQTAQAARALAVRLREADVRKGDKVVIWSENRPEWIAAFWACLLTGAIVVPVDYRASSGFLLRLRDKVQARVVWIGDEVVWPEGAEPRPWRLAEVDWLDTRTALPEPVNRDDLAEIVFTSGATADPKGVIITHRNILANIVPVEREIRKYRRFGGPFFPLRFLNLLPLSHMFGQAMATFVPPMLPGVVVFMRGYSPDEMIRQIRGRRISVLVSVPKVLDILREYVVRLCPESATALPPGARWPRRWWHYRRVHRLFGWKFWAFVVGAAPLAPDVEEFWSRLGFLTIQGYGLTETAPIVTLNHPFHARRGTVGTPIGGVEVKIAPDGEILVRGENVSSGYFGAAPDTPDASFEDGWLHTGDIGAFDAEGRLLIRGRKKEMIVTPEGLNVFPEDVERVLDEIPGVKESAAVGKDRVHAVMVLDPGADAAAIVRAANSKLEDHQRIQGLSLWPERELPRTEGTGKLKRAAIWQWVNSGGRIGPAEPSRAGSAADRLIAQYARGRTLTPETTLEELGLSSLERVELMIQLGVSEPDFQVARTVGDLTSIREQPAVAAPTQDIPSWPRSRTASWVRDIGLALVILPLARLFAWLRIEGRENLEHLDAPVIFASNHQSHFDGPSILMALPYRLRRRVAIAASREFFAAHFHPERFSRRQRFTSGLSFFLASLFFNIFPLPQREVGAMDALRYAGRLMSEGWCVLIFPEGDRTDAGEIHAFQPGVGMMASRLAARVVPVRLEGLDRILHKRWRMAKPGHARIKFGAPLRLEGDDYTSLARRVEAAVRAL